MSRSLTIMVYLLRVVKSEDLFALWSSCQILSTNFYFANKVEKQKMEGDLCGVEW